MIDDPGLSGFDRENRFDRPRSKRDQEGKSQAQGAAFLSLALVAAIAAAPG
jgi:hypothetical protein